MLLFLPLALAEQLHSRAVEQQVQRPVRDDTWAPPSKAAAAPAQGGVVRDAELEPEQPEHAADKTLGLAQGEMEHQPQGQHQLDRQVRVTGLAAWCRPSCRLPPSDRRLIQPERQIAPTAKAGIVCGPVPNPVLRPQDAVTASSVVLERQGTVLSWLAGTCAYADRCSLASLRAPTLLNLSLRRHATDRW